MLLQIMLLGIGGMHYWEASHDLPLPGDLVVSLVARLECC